MSRGCEAAIGSCRPGGRRLVWALAALLFVLGACDECWDGSCDDFTCRTDSVVVVRDETKVFPPFPPSCDPWSGPRAAYTVKVLDAAIVTARIEDRQLLITGQTPGETYVLVDATVEGNPNTAQFAYHVITVEPT